MESIPHLILPGYGGSGPAHWQTHWERLHPEFTRVEETDWDAPDCARWVAALDKAVRGSGPGTVLIAHSMACLQLAHWVEQRAGRCPEIRAAFVVAPPDPAGPEFPRAAQGFSPVPSIRFPFSTLVVGSTNDPYAGVAFTQACARSWGARVVSAGPLGHINASSGLGEWPQGQRLLASLWVETSTKR